MTTTSPTPSIHNTELITVDDVIIIGGIFARAGKNTRLNYCHRA